MEAEKQSQRSLQQLKGNLPKKRLMFECFLQDDTRAVSEFKVCILQIAHWKNSYVITLPEGLSKSTSLPRALQMRSTFGRFEGCTVSTLGAQQHVLRFSYFFTMEHD